jgi:Phospholipase B
MAGSGRGEYDSTFHGFERTYTMSLSRAGRSPFLAALLLSLLSTAGEAMSALPDNAGFETAGVGRLPQGWSVIGHAVEADRVSMDEGVARTGKRSLKIEHATPGETVVSSEALILAIGHVYRLTGWIRTRKAFSDPLARYPTALPACLAMESFPFTNQSPSVGGDSAWTKVEVMFVATASTDQVRLILGRNGAATGTAWFDDVAVDEVTDIREFIPMETLRWSGEGYRYDDGGWTFVHVEGEPYGRGHQYGSLLSEEIGAYVAKLSNLENAKDPAAGWNALRLLADTAFLRGFDEEYLTEMKGIADGASAAGAKIDGRPVDLLDIVTVNSAVDISQLQSALRVTPHALTGQSFLSPADEMRVPDERHKCSALVATGPATKSGRVVFGQLFMWSGYTGVHFNVICDVVPSKGHRLVYQTFPGGIHSGTDFYVNSAGIVIGETTVAQTPFERSGTPQSNRIRHAAQYAGSIDDVARILTEKNNGLYTNDWLIADVKTDETAILLLGTKEHRLWRSSDRPAPFGSPGFLSSNNNARDEAVRREYAVQAEDAPADVVFSPSNRDVAFQEFYARTMGKIDVEATTRLFASSPVERPHACDGKVTTSEMAEKLVFLAHYGKTTLREKFPSRENRRMPDLPGAFPHLTLGYTAASPVWITEKLKEARKADAPMAADKDSSKPELGPIAARYAVKKDRLWRGTVFPASDADAWLASGGAAYWQLLHGLPDAAEKAAVTLRDELAALNDRYLWISSREGDLSPSDATRSYTRYGEYLIPRLKGTFALHQLRLLLGDEAFLGLMKRFHASHARKETRGAEFVEEASRVAGRDVAVFLSQWTMRTGLPDPDVKIAASPDGKGWVVRVEVVQKGTPYHFLTSMTVEAGGKEWWKPIEVNGERSVSSFRFQDRPLRAVFNAGQDVPVQNPKYFTWINFADGFRDALIVHGTGRQVEANKTLALRWQTTLADAWTETLVPVVKDCEVSDEELAGHDLIVLGTPAENSVTARMASRLPALFGRNHFRWDKTDYGRPDAGLFLVLPNPFNPKRTLFLIAGNSALELHQMTKAYSNKIPSWAVFRGDEVKRQGYHAPERFVFEGLTR